MKKTIILLLMCIALNLSGCNLPTNDDTPFDSTSPANSPHLPQMTKASTSKVSHPKWELIKKNERYELWRNYKENGHKEIRIDWFPKDKSKIKSFTIKEDNDLAINENEPNFLVFFNSQGNAFDLYVFDYENGILSPPFDTPTDYNCERNIIVSSDYNEEKNSDVIIFQSIFKDVENPVYIELNRKFPPHASQVLLEKVEFLPNGLINFTYNNPTVEGIVSEVIRIKP